MVYTSSFLVPIPSEVRLPRTFSLDGHSDCLIVLVALLDDDFYRRRHFIGRVGVGRPGLRRRRRGLRGRRGAGVDGHGSGLPVGLPLHLTAARFGGGSLLLQCWRVPSTRVSCSRCVFAGRRGHRSSLALKLPFLAAPVGPASVPGLGPAVRRGVERRLRGRSEPSRSPHLVGAQNSAPLSLARRAVRAREATERRARSTQVLPLGSTIGSGRNRSAHSWAAPRAALCRRGARARHEAASGARPVPRTAPGS